jgi:hypothetical protein
MANSTLDAIHTKVRRLTRSPSISQISDAQIDEYVNTFILFDFPSQLRLFSLRSLLTFYTQPGVDVYSTTTTVVTDPLYNFKNRYIAVHPPLYMAGIQCFYTQERDVFYGYWPQTNSIIDTQLRGNGTMGPFVGQINSSQLGTVPYPFILQNSVNFNCLDVNNNSMVLVDIPISNTIGNLTIPNVPLFPPYDTIQNPNNYINYLTGQWVVTFPNPTQQLAQLWFEGILYQPGKPLGMLYYDDKFTIRPVPDKTYQIQIEVDVRPTQLIQTTDIPYLEEWWQYISYGTSKKIFEDRMDMDSVQLIMPEFKQQERFVLRTTLTQQANERTTTIYSQGKQYGFGWFNSNWPY